MQNNREVKYILFPLPLLQEIFKKPKNGFGDIFYYGIYRSSMHMDIDRENAIRQALYSFYRGGLTKSLERKFNDLVNSNVLDYDSDYNGFSSDGNTFDPAIEINDLNNYEDEEFKEEIEVFYRLFLIKDILSLKFDIETAIKVYNKYNTMYGNFEGQPLVMVNTGIMIDYANNKKSEFEHILFAAYAGIRSIIGRGKKYTATTQDMIFCRMLGAKNQEALNMVLEDKKVKAIYNKYSNRYQREKIIKNLLVNRFISSKIWFNKRLYVSCSLSYEELTQAVIDHVKSVNFNLKYNELKNKEIEAKNAILQHLNNNNSLNNDNI